jgi:malate dehydrogenase (oxaloacetate-decarboxylating)
MAIHALPASRQYIAFFTRLSSIPLRGQLSPYRQRNLLQKSRFPAHLLTMAHVTRQMSSHHKETKPNEKHPKFGSLPLSTSGPQDCALTGTALLNTPYLNKGAAFPPEERKTFKLTGLLPQNVSTLDQQVKRAYQQYSTRADDLAKNTFMTSLAEQNEVLYFRVS